MARPVETDPACNEPEPPLFDQGGVGLTHHSHLAAKGPLWPSTWDSGKPPAQSPRFVSRLSAKLLSAGRERVLLFRGATFTVLGVYLSSMCGKAACDGAPPRGSTIRSRCRESTLAL